MDDQLIQRVTNIVEIVGVLWVLIIGSKTIPNLLKGKLPLQVFSQLLTNRTLLQLLISFVLGVVIVASIEGVLGISKIPWQIPNFGTQKLLPATPDANATSTAIDQSTATAEVSATAQVIKANPYPSYLPGHGYLVVYDALNMYQPDSDRWWGPSYSSNGDAETCEYSNGYHIRESRQGYYFYCFSYYHSPISDFALEVNMTVLFGNCGGIFFRADIQGGSAYYFRVCQSGNYELIRYSDFSSAHSTVLISPTSNSAIRIGLNQNNLITVVAQGETIKLYVNKQFIGSTQDSIYHEGDIALAVDAFSVPTEVKFMQAKVWILLS